MTNYQYLKVVALVLLLNSEMVHAQEGTIADVVVRGNQRIDASAILNAIASKSGEYLDSDRTDADIRAIRSEERRGGQECV